MPKSSNRNKNSVPALSFASKVLTLIVVALIIISTVYIVAKFFGDDIKQALNKEEEKPVVKVDMELVNTEQVNWAKNMCIETGKWQAVKSDLPKYEQPTSPLKIRKDMIAVLKKNSEIADQRANRIVTLPFYAWKEAQEQQDRTLVTDNNKIIGDAPNSNTVATSEEVAASLRNYAQALRDMANGVDSISNYNFTGIRYAIINAHSDLQRITDSLNENLTATFDPGTFDNTVTMGEVAKIPDCKGAFISIDKLNQVKGEELGNQNIIRGFVTQERCRAFMEDAKLVTDKNDELNENIAACDTVLSGKQVDASDPLVSGEINTMDSERAKPNTARMGIVKSGESENAEESTTTTDSSTSSSSKTSSSKSKDSSTSRSSVKKTSTEKSTKSKTTKPKSS